MSQYLDEAAAQLRKVAQSIEHKETSSKYGCKYDAERQQLAREFATLAAIDKGLLPADITRDVLNSLITQHA